MALLKAYVFVDGQAVFHQAQNCFGYREANYDPIELAKYIVSLDPNREFKGFFFYTGIPSRQVQPNLYDFWSNKVRAIKRKATGVPTLEEHKVFRRRLLYRDITVIDKKTGKPRTIKKGREKGIDLRLSLDAVRNARLGKYDELIIFSQDSDLTELVKEVKDIASSQGRTVTIESAYPYSATPVKKDTFLYGIDGTIQRKIEKSDYDNCLDPLTTTYWPSPKRYPLFSK